MKQFKVFFMFMISLMVASICCSCSSDDSTSRQVDPTERNYVVFSVTDNPDWESDIHVNTLYYMPSSSNEIFPEIESNYQQGNLLISSYVIEHGANVIVLPREYTDGITLELKAYASADEMLSPDDLLVHEYQYSTNGSEGGSFTFP